MDSNAIIKDRGQKLKELKLLLNKVEDELVFLTRDLNWDYNTLSGDLSDMATCSFNPHHRMPNSSLKMHEEKCAWRSEGYTNNEKIFPEHSGIGSFVTLTAESLCSITRNVSSSTEFNNLRAVPQSSANFDQNFEREEKLAIYDYVVSNTRKQKSYIDLSVQPFEKSEKKEKAAWEIAAAERDAKRRRASYRNKVHTNRKTQTEILREVIEAQMEVLKADIVNEKVEEEDLNNLKIEEDFSTSQTVQSKTSNYGKKWSDKNKHLDPPSRLNEENQSKKRNHHSHSKSGKHKRSPPDTGSDNKSRSRFHDKHRKWKTYKGRSHSHRSSHSHRR